ncbi:MAG: 3-oxoacyl-ACP reductase FabG [Acidobacteria bacterium]|nr:3-oxoacyl-ACP reductase FabG [Acidobacteriota bacterium]MCB9397872.1 3-oxoacyl-ACP reductase FabG [Acidobacteriota bacterium]
MTNLTGKKALVTGGSRGIGAAIVQALGEAGADVVFTYLDRHDQARNRIEELAAKGLPCAAYAMDQSEPDQVHAVIEQLTGLWGRLDILVNNAGINKPTDFDQIQPEDWDRILDVNLKGPFLVSQAALPLLKAAKQSSVVFIGSVSGQYGGPRTAHYAASKAGLISLAQVFARFGAPFGIRANTVAAGLIASEMAQAGLQSAAVQAATKNILLQRMGTPEEVAQAVVYLASEASSYMTAQTLNINGGLYF